jgi:hypothetical protein
MCFPVRMNLPIASDLGETKYKVETVSFVPSVSLPTRHSELKDESLWDMFAVKRSQIQLSHTLKVIWRREDNW